ncbi:chaperone protein DnaJ [Reticulomyxa filosa]|uniref:Chaperone protein DnaJ n=1 Tax=Reticulomyxa filosa TaxID=46433 RepID=X6P412_RETFI|nr:chaperone protein DnaJ [Reticulomyxa filosa]|eukprot:ETO32829.1 chaperone protein DnaJ [Reticulomyxa filosa]
MAVRELPFLFILFVPSLVVSKRSMNIVKKKKKKKKKKAKRTSNISTLSHLIALSNFFVCLFIFLQIYRLCDKHRSIGPNLSKVFPRLPLSVFPSFHLAVHHWRTDVHTFTIYFFILQIILLALFLLCCSFGKTTNVTRVKVSAKPYSRFLHTSQVGSLFNRNKNRSPRNLNYHTQNSFTTKADYYELLGVSKEASDQDIKKAFYKVEQAKKKKKKVTMDVQEISGNFMAKQWHPDANKAPEAKDKFSEINEAYQVLSNKEKRAQYDQFGHNMNGQSFHPTDFGDINLNDLFSQLFSGIGRVDPVKTGPQKGSDLQVEMSLSFMEAVNGTTKEIKTQRYDECTTCNSTGMEPGSKKQRCKSCNGKGVTIRQQGFMVVQSSCRDCGGTGESIDPCRKCHGNGIVPGTFALKATIPRGVDDGTRVRVANQGHAAQNKGGRGHAYVLCRVSYLFFFGNLYLYNKYIYILTVPTLTGEAEVNVKPGTPPDHKEVMRFKGIEEPQTSKIGHQYLFFNIVIPKDLTDRQKQLITEFGNIQGSKNPNSS